MDTFLRLFEITLPEGEAAEAFDVPKYLLGAPAAVMLAVSARAIVFWIMNVVLVFLVIPMARRSIFKDGDEDAIGEFAYDGPDEGDDRHYSRNNNHMNKQVWLRSFNLHLTNVYFL